MGNLKKNESIKPKNLNLKEEFEYIENHFKNISKEQLYKDLVECGLNTQLANILVSGEETQKC